MAWVLAAGVEQDRAGDIVLASYEALANVADHAYDGSGAGVVDLDAAVHPDRLEVVITDHGQWRMPVPDPRPVSLRGRGLLLLRRIGRDPKLTAIRVFGPRPVKEILAEQPELP